MSRMNRVVTYGAIGAISVLALVGCSSPQAPTASTTAEPTAETVAASTTDTASFDPLWEVISKTRTAVEAGDFAKAQTEFEQFEGHWQTVEDGVKDRVPDTYDAIEEGMDSLTGALKASNADKANSALDTLETNIQSAAQP